MKNKNSLINWGIIIAILIGSGLLTIILPAFFGGSSTPLPSETSMVTMQLPIPVGGRTEFTLPSWQLMVGLFILIPGLVIGAGLTLALIYILLSRLVAQTTASADYQENSAALQKRYNDEVAKMRQTRPTSIAPESTSRRWSVVTTAITILMFVAFITFLFASLIFPDGQIIRDSSIVNVTSALVLRSGLGIRCLRRSRASPTNCSDSNIEPIFGVVSLRGPHRVRNAQVRALESAIRVQRLALRGEIVRVNASNAELYAPGRPAPASGRPRRAACIRDRALAASPGSPAPAPES